MQQPPTLCPPRNRFRAALYGLAPGMAMIAIATGFRLDPQSASAFSGRTGEFTQSASLRQQVNPTQSQPASQPEQPNR